MFALYYDHFFHGRPQGFGPGAITYAEIHAYQSLTGQTLDPWLVRMLRVVDTLYLTAGGRVKSRPVAK